MAVFSFDEIDLNIVDQLRRNGRINNQNIAEQLGLTAVTVSSRIKRMEDAAQLRVVAVTDFAAQGTKLLLRLAVEVKGRPASEVAADLAKLPQVFAIHLMTGRYDIDMLVGMRSYEELTQLALGDFAMVRGIRSFTPSIVADIHKYQFDVAPIRPADEPIPASALDPLDQRLVEMLASDARVSNRKVATELGVTEGTVRTRIKRLQADGLIAFTAITGFELSKKARLGFIYIQADIDRLSETAAAIAALPQVNAVLVTLGPVSIIAMCLFDEMEALVELASDNILPMKGVRHVETAIAVKTVRYNSQVVKIIKRETTEID